MIQLVPTNHVPDTCIQITLDKNADDKNADDTNADDKNADDKNADDMTCAICLTNVGGPHDCVICAPNAWHICKPCSLRLKNDSKCPICRIEKPPTRVMIVRSEISEHYIGACMIKLLNIILNIIVITIFVAAFVYLGKSFVYINCFKKSCEPPQQDCTCDRSVYHSDFWITYNNILGEFVCGLLTAVLITVIYVLCSKCVTAMYYLCSRTC